MSYIPIHDFREQSIESPDGKYRAEVKSVREFQMSGPVYGDLTVGDFVKSVGVGVSICWSKDSGYLAAPELDAKKPEFKVAIFNISTGVKRYAPGAYGPIGIKSFDGSRIVLVHLDRTEQNLDVSKIQW